MKKFYKIAIIIVLVLIIAVLFVFLTLPIYNSNAKLISQIMQNSQLKITYENNIKSLLKSKSNFYMYNALFDKYNTQIPLNGNISILTDQIYELEKYSGVKIKAISFKDLDIKNKSNKPNEEDVIGNVIIDLNANGTYYQILTFINALEIMPRFIKIEAISLKTLNVTNESSTEYNNLNLLPLDLSITFRAFYDKTDYNKKLVKQ